MRRACQLGARKVYSSAWSSTPSASDPMSPKFDFGWQLPYAAQRQPVLGDDVVAASQPLAVQAGMAMYELGGNAMDAALASAIALTVVEPTSNGIGGDAFAIVAQGNRLYALNGSGRAPAAMDVDRLYSLKVMPPHGWDTVTVPGAVSAWTALHERFGRLEFRDLFQPAVRYAREGFLVSPRTAEAWHQAEQLHSGRRDFAAAFLPGGRAPRVGERFRSPDQAATLEEIAVTEGRSFYQGRLAERIVAHALAENAPLGLDDLAGHDPFWVEPIEVNYGDVTLHEIPPNSQGVAPLLAMAILERVGVADRDSNHADSIHLEAEAMKRAFAEVARHVGDPDAMTLGVADLLAPDRVASLADGIDPDRATDPGLRSISGGGTVYLTAADRAGMMVSYIQSNYDGFGSGVVVPGTGIALQNRGACFQTDPDHPNAVAPRRRPFHTIIPGFATSRGEPLMAFGVTGGPMQPQGHVQLVRRIADGGENPQAALDAPRWRVSGGLDTAIGGRMGGSWTLHLEGGIGPRVVEDLRSRGHRIVLGQPFQSEFGGGQVALRLRHGGYLAASDSRKDGHAAGR